MELETGHSDSRFALQDMSIAGHQGKATGEGRINRGKGSDEGSGTRSSLMWETIHIIEKHGANGEPRYVDMGKCEKRGNRNT